MRISTSMIFERASSKISDMQSTLTKTQQQLSSQRRILTPADDPIASSSMLALTQTMSINDQFATNRQAAKNALNQQESVLTSVTSLLQDVKELVVTAGNGAMDDAQRSYLASALRGHFDELLGLANSRDGAGDYMFSGFQIGSQPFSQTPTGAQYSGDQGLRMLKIGPSRQIALNDAGSAIFESNKTGNGTFATAPASKINPATFTPIAPATANTGSGTISSGTVVDASKLTGHDYSIVFSSNPASVPANPLVPDIVSFAVKDNVTNQYWDSTTNTWGAAPPPAPVPGTTPPAPWTPYVSDQAVTVDGLQFVVSGTPADGDAFSIKPSTNQSIFTTLNNLLTTLTSTSVGANGQANLTNGLASANDNVDNALDKILDIRASLGTRLKEIDTLDSTGSDLNLQYQDAMNKLDGFDMAASISSFTQQNATLEAAQKTFTQISQLSLFKFI